MPQDWWNTNKNRPHPEHNILMTELYEATNYKVIVAVSNCLELSEFNGCDYLPYTNNIICLNYWAAYNSSFIEFNINPINKILISGCLLNIHYPERYKLSNLNNNNIYVYKYNNNDFNNDNYNKVLNNYLCCFVSSVYIYNKKYNKYLNTHIIILKIYETLASGSLLLVPNTEESYLKNIGLINNIHYMTINLDGDINDKINYIINPINRHIIDNIRKNGNKYCKENLTNIQKFNELNKIFTE